MATITVYSPQVFGSAFTNISNITDNSDTTYGDGRVPSNSSIVILVRFDLSAIPYGSTITKFSLSSYCGIDSNVTGYLYACRKYVNGTFVEDKSLPNVSFGTASTLTTNTVYDDNKSGGKFGLWTTDELINSSISSTSPYSGMELYIRYKNSSYAYVRHVYPRYYKLTVTYTPPALITATFKNYDQSIITSTQLYPGQTPSDSGISETPERPNDPQYAYTFSGWEPELGPIYSDQIYVAKYTQGIRNYIISVSNSDPTLGTVSVDGVVLTEPRVYEFLKQYGTQMTIVATPNAHSVFMHWIYNIPGAYAYDNNSTLNLTVSGSNSYNAYFRTCSIYVGTQKITNLIYKGNMPIYGIYVGTKKVYSID